MLLLDFCVLAVVALWRASHPINASTGHISCAIGLNLDEIAMNLEEMQGLRVKLQRRLTACKDDMLGLKSCDFLQDFFFGKLFIRLMLYKADALYRKIRKPNCILTSV